MQSACIPGTLLALHAGLDCVLTRGEIGVSRDCAVKPSPVQECSGTIVPCSGCPCNDLRHSSWSTVLSPHNKHQRGTNFRMDRQTGEKHLTGPTAAFFKTLKKTLSGCAVVVPPCVPCLVHDGPENGLNLAQSRLLRLPSSRGQEPKSLADHLQVSGHLVRRRHPHQVHIYAGRPARRTPSPLVRRAENTFQEVIRCHLSSALPTSERDVIAGH